MPTSARTSTIDMQSLRNMPVAWARVPLSTHGAAAGVGMTADDLTGLGDSTCIVVHPPRGGQAFRKSGLSQRHASSGSPDKVCDVHWHPALEHPCMDACCDDQMPDGGWNITSWLDIFSGNKDITPIIRIGGASEMLS